MPDPPDGYRHMEVETGARTGERSDTWGKGGCGLRYDSFLTRSSAPGNDRGRKCSYLHISLCTFLHMAPEMVVGENSPFLLGSTLTGSHAPVAQIGDKGEHAWRADQGLLNPISR